MSARQYLKGAWLLAAALVLGAVLFAYDGKPNSDVGQFLVGAMLLLGFPGALAGAAAIGAAYASFDLCCGVVVKTSYVSLLLEWLVLAVSGYLQWFLLVPWILKKWVLRKGVRDNEPTVR